MTHRETDPSDPGRPVQVFEQLPLIGSLLRGWRQHPVAGVSAGVVVLLGLVAAWSDIEGTFGKRFLDEEAATARQADQLRTDMSHVAEGVADATLEVHSVGVQMDAVLARTEVLQRLADSGQVIVALPAEKLAQLRQLQQPRIQLHWYDAQGSRIAFDDTAPEFEPGQFVNVRLLDPLEASTPAHKYLLVIQGDGRIELAPEEAVSASRGDWRIESGHDNESLLVLAADHELTQAEQDQLVLDLKDVLPPRPLPLRRHSFYEWRNGEIYQVARAGQTRDLQRNPQAPADWAADVTEALADRGLSFHGYTYPVLADGEPVAAEPAP